MIREAHAKMWMKMLVATWITRGVNLTVRAYLQVRKAPGAGLAKDGSGYRYDGSHTYTAVRRAHEALHEYIGVGVICVARLGRSADVCDGLRAERRSVPMTNSVTPEVSAC
jgi:hypothetical protein